MKFILGKKLNMTQVWQNDEAVAVTKVQAGPCTVVQIKNDEKDKYRAVQIGFGEKKEKNIKKPQIGHLKGLGNFRYLREFRAEPGDLKRGAVIDISTFAVGDKINVTGISKGKGFQGVVKRHGFKGSKKTHGNKDQLRMPGSIGATGPAHVFKGVRMPGHMGNERVTTTNLEIVEIDKENNLLLVKGAVPGARNSLLLIAGEGDLTATSEEIKIESKTKESVKSEAKSGVAESIKSKVESKAESNKEDDKIENNKKESGKAEAEKKEEADTPEKVEKEVVEAKKRVDGKKDTK